MIDTQIAYQSCAGTGGSLTGDMTSPSDLDTPFRRQANVLPSPLRENFSPAAWEQAFATIAKPTLDDQRLFAAVQWIGAKAQILYASHVERFSSLGRADATVLAIAVLNHEYRVLRANARAAMAEASADTDGPVTLDHASNIRFENAHGQRMSAGDYLEAFVDALDAWLYDAARLPDTSEPPPDNVAALVPPLVHFYSMRHILKRLFDKVLHLGHYLDDDGVWVPHDCALATLHQAWFARAQAVFGAAPAKLMDVWSGLSRAERRRCGLSRSITEFRTGRHDARFKVETLSYLSNRPPQQPLIRAGARASYLADFLDQPLPLMPDLTAAMIEDAWWICEDGARAITSAALRSRDGIRIGAQHANAIAPGDLIDAISKALGVDPKVADQLVAFLTYGAAPRRSKGERARDSDHGWRGLWSAPLVLVPDRGVLLLAPAVFEQCAPLFRIEAWLEKGGLNDQGATRQTRGRGSRGTRFEELYRAQLCEALSQNDGLRTSRVAASEIRKEDGDDGFPEQIDILFKLGRRLFVGELKFLLTPADPHQWSRHYEKLANAAAQARSKAASLDLRRDVAAAALGFLSPRSPDCRLRPL
jgi:hypothetical protein